MLSTSPRILPKVQMAAGRHCEKDLLVDTEAGCRKGPVDCLGLEPAPSVQVCVMVLSGMAGQQSLNKQV